MIKDGLAWAALVTAAAAASGQPIRAIETHGDASEVACLAVGDAGALWVGTRGAGMFRLEASGEIVRRDAVAGLPGNAVRACVVHERLLWVATEGGLASWDRAHDRFEVVRSGRCLALAAVGAHLAVAYDDGSIELLGEGGGRRQLDLVPTSLAGGPDGELAAGSLSGEVWDGRDRTRHHLGIPVTDLAWRGDVLVAGTPVGERERASGGAFVAVAAPPFDPSLTGLEPLPVTARVVWQGRAVVGTGSGLYRATQAGWCRIELGGMPCGSRLTSLARFDGALWAGSFDRGLCRLDPDGWRRFSGPGVLPSDMVNDLASDGRQLFVATNGGLVTVDSELRFSTLGAPAAAKDPRHRGPWNAVINGVAANEGEVWLADFMTVHSIGRASWRHFDHRQGVTAAGLTRIAARAGRVAVGTGRSGVHVRDGGGGFTTIDDRVGLPENWVMDVAFGRGGELWVATCSRGVAHEATGGAWRRVTTAQGLADDATLALADIDGAMWVGTLAGLSIIDGDTVTTLSVRDGLSGPEVHDILADGDRVIVATDAGLTVYTRPPLPGPATITPESMR